MNTTEDERCKRNHETIFVPTPILHTVQEQGVELDYVLPDYEPDFFRLLHCTAEPTILHWIVQDGLLQYVCCVKLQVWYCAEQSKRVQVVTQRLEYNLQMALPPDQTEDSVRVQLRPCTAYINCRAINSRRMDLRGAIRIHVHVEGEQQRLVLRDLFGLHTHCQKEAVSYVSKILRTVKRCTLSEDVTVGNAQPPILTILRESAQITVAEATNLAGKLVVKGEALVELLYAAEEGVESLRFSIPLRQIVELEGLTEGMVCMAEAELAAHSITPSADGNGDLRQLHCDVQVRIIGQALQTTATELVTDCYSTVHPCTVQAEPLAFPALPTALHETVSCKSTLAEPDCVMTKIYAAWMAQSELQVTADSASHRMQIEGTVQFCVLAADADGAPMRLTKTETICHPLDLPYQSEKQTCHPTVQARSCSYTRTAADTVSIQAELLLTGNFFGATPHTVVQDAEVDAQARLPQAEPYALRLYFGQAQESLWEIAKRFRTSVSAIMEENDCLSPCLTDQQMLLIPIVQ